MFLGFIEAANPDCKFESDVLNFLNTLDINLGSVERQEYDGAANMSGVYAGLTKLIKDKQPRAKLRSLFNTQPQSCSKRCMY
ncbi:hypothetical protein TNCV_2911711 [Trichonephila clavipes]|nr:hypothetical protein TNCV_2911711 [Trichonephila clavipes]